MRVAIMFDVDGLMERLNESASLTSTREASSTSERRAGFTSPDLYELLEDLWNIAMSQQLDHAQGPVYHSSRCLNSGLFQLHLALPEGKF